MATKLADLDPLEYPPGTYKFKAVVSTGPILIQSKMPEESAFSTDTDGTITASENGVMVIGQGESIQVSLEAGDEFHLIRVDRGRV